MNLLKTAGLLSLMIGLEVLVGYLLIGNTIGAIIGFAIAAVSNFISWFYSDQIALTVYGAKPPTCSQAESLEPMIERLRDRADLPLPKIYVVPSGVANAFATGRNPQHGGIAVTTRLIQLLSTDELEAVIAHELTHIKNRDTLTQTIAATIAGAISLLAQVIGDGLWSFSGLRKISATAFCGLVACRATGSA